MFEIGWSELLIIAIVAVIVVGPKDLPRMLRGFGNTVGKLRRMAGEFQNQFNEALREAELADVKKQIEDVGKIDPLKELREEVKAIADQAKLDSQDVQKASTAPMAVEPPSAEPPQSASSAANGASPHAEAPAGAQSNAPDREPQPIGTPTLRH
jgi:sec-independent protein translocase protein TatB